MANTVPDLTSKITNLGFPIACGSFSKVYECTMRDSEGAKKVAVKEIIIDSNRDLANIEKAMLRELQVWIRLRHSTIVPLLGTTRRVDSPLLFLVSEWMPSGTLKEYLEKHATTLDPSSRVKLAKAVAGGLDYLRSKNVVHGHLQPTNVLIDGSGNPRLTGFGLATVAGDPELQWSATTAARDYNTRWLAPEVIGIDCEELVRPTFQSDIYSFGSIMFFIISGDIPWKEKKRSHQISIELSKKVTPTRPTNISNGHWNLIQKCWSWEPNHRPVPKEVINYLDQFGTDDSQESVSELTPLPISRTPGVLVDLTGQIFGTIGDYVAGGTFGNVYRCEWRQPHGPRVKVAVKVFMFHTSEQDLRMFQREAAIWGRLVHDNIVELFGTADGFAPTTALVLPWFPDGTLLHLIADQGARLSIRSKLKLLHGVASGLDYLHRFAPGFPVVHGDITSSNILVDVKQGEYKACITDFGLSTALGEDSASEGSDIRRGAIRWTAPELLSRSSNVTPDTPNDMYSFGCVMFHVLTLVIPWHDIDDDKVLQKVIGGERPERSDALSDITDACWNEIEKCWSVNPSARPSAQIAMLFLKSELEIFINDDILVGEVQKNHQSTSLDTSQRTMGLRTQAHRANIIPRHLSARVPTLSNSSSGPLNVLVFGDIGAGKSSIINLIAGRDIAQTSSEASSLENPSYDVDIGTLRFRIWEITSVGPTGFFRAPFLKWRLKNSYKKLYKDGVCLLLYCIRGRVEWMSRKALIRDYKIFTDVVGSTAGLCDAPVAAVVNSLDDYPPDMDMDNWWQENERKLEELGMRFSKHACITSLPDDLNASPVMRKRRQQSEQAICKLICDSHQARR
ncbi:kinase-like domain-containing protein [Suillus ampliporus]|nr:kinase-like domain-containing protein [Suillus ampliporus]